MALHDIRIDYIWHKLAAEWAAVLLWTFKNQPKFPKQKKLR